MKITKLPIDPKSLFTEESKMELHHTLYTKDGLDAIEFYKQLLSDDLLIANSEKNPIKLIKTWGLADKCPITILFSKLNEFYKNNNIEFFLYNNTIYMIRDLFSEDDAKLLIMEHYDSERKKFERLKNKFSGIKETKHERIRIPESVRIEVWRRDQGMCAQCGSREKLEYDHIVPVSKGGSNTSRNIELLCETCNKRKSNNIQ